MSKALQLYFRICFILIKLKSWKVLFMAVVSAALTSNLSLYRSADSLMIQLGEKSFHMIGAEEFQRDSIVLGDVSQYDRQIAILSDYVSATGAKSSFQQNIRRCESDTDCQDEYLRLLVGSTPGKIAHYVDYHSSAGNRTKLFCQLSLGNELYCPYMAYLVSISQAQKLEKNFFYNKTSVFKLLESIPFYTKNISGGSDTVCARESDFIDVFPTTLLLQVVLIILTLVFYLFVSTVTCIYELKKSGYLQLMFRKGLSVFVYWLAIWTITLLEMVIFAAVLPVAYHYQCQGFYSSQKLSWVFLLALAQFCCLASLVLLSTVLTRRTDVAGLLACLVCLVVTGEAVVNRFALGANINKDNNLYRYIMLAVPTGHLVEQILTTILSDLMEKKNTFVWIVLPVSACFPVLVTAVSMYLDCVLKSGNGLRLSLLYPFCTKFYRLSPADRTLPAELAATVMTEAALPHWKPIVCVRGLKKNFSPTLCGKETAALNAFSANFYQDQITAIVGHNGSGKSTLMQILSGERNATSGLATISRIPVTESLTRYHISSSIGYCPQSDALVNRMSVCDTIKLAVLSTGHAWSHVESQVRHILSSLGIESKFGESIQNLSYSEKRKVSVTLALIGEPMVVLLDDPTRDMDYVARRRVWQLLHELKNGCSIIVNTQIIGEAEAAADRLVFMSSGRVICAGSAFFFKRAFDCGYIIQIACKTEHHVPFLIERISLRFKSVRVRSVGCSDLELEVPITEDEILPGVIREIEKFPGLIDEFGIANFRLDDVFCKFKDLTAEDIEDHFRKGTVGNVAEDYDRIVAIKNRPERSLPVGLDAVRKSPCSWIGTITVMLDLNCKLIARSKVRLFVRVIVPILFLVALAVASVLEKLAKSHNTSISYNLSNTTLFERERGVCMYFYSMVLGKTHWEVLSQGECGFFISGDKRSDTNVHGLVMDPIYVGKSLQELLVLHLPHIRKKCQKATHPCPIAYSTAWCPHEDVSASHQVYVGSYVNSDTYTADSVAMTAIEVFRNMVSYITHQIFQGRRSVRPDFDTLAIQDIQTIFYRLYGLFVQLAMVVVMPVIFLNDVLQDKSTGVRRQLLTMGVSRFKYWFCSIICHWLQFAVIFTIGIVIQVCIVSSAYKTTHYLTIIMPVTLAFGLVNNLLCIYLLGIVIGRARCVPIATYVLTSMLISLSVHLVKFNHLAGRILIMVCPQFATIALSFYGVRFIYYSSAYYEATGGSRLLSLMGFISSRHITDSLLAIAIHFVLLVFLLAILDNRHRIYSLCRHDAIYSTDIAINTSIREPSICLEMRRLTEDPFFGQNILEATYLRVVEPGRKIVLKSLTLRLKRGEVLGLVGPRGSGIHSAVRAIVGIEKYTCAGEVDIQIGNRWVHNITAAGLGHIGYCPGSDPLYQRLTVHENLSFYARISGIPSGRIRQVLTEFFLDSDVSTVVMHATAGVKRRLTLAIALLASPEFVAIDNTAAGVDPHGKQILWRSIQSQVCKRRGILIATQNMEECETLCDRIGIMNHGLLLTLNSIDELLHRYKGIYLLEMQMKDDDGRHDGDRMDRKADAVRIICDRFAGAAIIECFTSLLQFAVPILSMDCLSSALSWLVDNKSRLGVLHFTLHYASIDQTMKAIVASNDNCDSQPEAPTHSASSSEQMASKLATDS